jgi:putative molybdopterin biosynthesis protein
MPVMVDWGGVVSLKGQEVDLRVCSAMLDAVARTGSLRAAADELRLSYRAVWGRMEALERAFGRPLVAKTKGHGSTLTDLGRDLLDATQETARDLAPALAVANARLEARLAPCFAPAPASRVRFAASHDPILFDALADAPEIALTTTGSREAVERLLAGDADVAGFHGGGEEPPSGPPFDALSDAALYERLPLFTREQGLMLAPGNPLSITSVRDLAREGIRFVNRQKGSGTRVWLDRLLGAEGLSGQDIRGYGNEEFTHRAVAAIIASGAADAGMGAASVAERFGLAFLPLGRETYFLASERANAGALTVIERRWRARASQRGGA